MKPFEIPIEAHEAPAIGHRQRRQIGIRVVHGARLTPGCRQNASNTPEASALLFTAVPISFGWHTNRIRPRAVTVQNSTRSAAWPSHDWSACLWWPWPPQARASHPFSSCLRVTRSLAARALRRANVVRLHPRGRAPRVRV